MIQSYNNEVIKRKNGIWHSLTLDRQSMYANKANKSNFYGPVNLRCIKALSHRADENGRRRGPWGLLPALPLDRGFGFLLILAAAAEGVGADLLRGGWDHFDSRLHVAEQRVAVRCGNHFSGRSLRHLNNINNIEHIKNIPTKLN